MEILCFFAGIAFFYLKSFYPLYFLCAAFFFRPKPILVVWFISALLWSFFHQWHIADQGMPCVQLIQNTQLQGYIASIPTQSTSKIQFEFFAKYLDGYPIKANILLSCYEHCPDIHVGQYWQLQAKLKKPKNLNNPGGFDYVSWLSSRHISWVGNVVRSSFKLIPSPKNIYALSSFREHLSENISNVVQNDALLGVIEALTLGLTNHIKKPQWDLFRRTGTTHLIDISGEHIALIAGLTYWLIKWGWKRMGQLCLLYPAPKVASAGAILISFIYALVAGFAVPTQRALVTCCFMLMRNFSNQKFSIWQAWRYALFTVLLFEPHSVFMLGFYFSLIAVAILILINQRAQLQGLRKMFVMQCACMFGLMPLSLYWFSYGSMNGLVANLLAIPWVGFIIVPLALIVVFISPFFVIPGSVSLLKWSISCLILFLTWLDSFAMFNFNFTFTEALPSLSLMGAMAILLFLPLSRFIPASMILIIASLFPNHEKIKLGTARIDVLDVGQGLAVIIRTAHHIAIYDTGMKFYQAGDMGQLAIIPYLNKLGIHKIDSVIISHPDLDHRGGLNSLNETYPIRELIVDDPTFYMHGTSCHDHSAWSWDGISFRFFPILVRLPRKNNNSCVLQISSDSKQMLLSGDIEKIAEKYLIKTYGDELASTFLLIPHHGSKTSSSNAFINQVVPQYAIASYGFDNRYHFPHQEAMQTYQKHHIPVYNTADCGMIRIELSKNNKAMPKCFR